MTEMAPARVTMDTLVSLCKRRGFVYPGSEIYGGLANTWDYGPLGVELRNNIKQAWWKTFVHQRRDIVGIDGGILMNPRVWEASGHVDEFNDPLVDCRECRGRFRADTLVEDATGSTVEGMNPTEIDRIIADSNVACPTCGKRNWTTVRAFNMMFRTQIGPVDETATTVYLRPETAQSIFMQYKNVMQSSRARVPFGIAQVGKAFRNEITPGNFIFRVLELEQMEIEYFIREEDWESAFEEWMTAQLEFLLSLGVNRDHLRPREHTAEEMSHYSRRTVDYEYLFPFGWKELTGLAYRYDFDLKRHQEVSGVDMSYFDQAANERFIPHVIEPTMGVERLMLMVLLDAYEEEQTTDASGKDASRVVLRLDKHIAPFKVAVLPLSKKPELSGVAEDVFHTLQQHVSTDYDETQSIGRRYRRQDEIGTPLCVTVDFETLEDKAVTIRDRDTMEQARVAIDELVDNVLYRLGSGS
jgi:glycyl-tRNA synthetase